MKRLNKIANCFVVGALLFMFNLSTGLVCVTSIDDTLSHEAQTILSLLVVVVSILSATSAVHELVDMITKIVKGDNEDENK